MSERKGIGEGGKTLKQMLEENSALYEETGCYAGVIDPHVLRDDPVRTELFHSRIISALISGRETTKKVSGSPFVREVAELCVGFYTAEGDCIAQSTGIQVHIRCMGDVIKWMIENNYEEEVEIRDGDIFSCNDPAIAGVHAADIYDIMPIFWEEELVGWVATVIMEMDSGAVTPGCMPVANVERATDGLKFCAEKIGFNDRLRRDYEIKIEFSLGLADLFLLDRKGAVAADIRVREEVKSMIREFGLDYFKQATRELIEEERRSQFARTRQRTVPGRYRDVVPCEIYMKDQPVAWLPGKKDMIRLVPIQMDILPSGNIELDFEGTGEWDWHPFNATPSALWGGLSIAVIQTFSYDGRGNLGSLLPFDMKAPLGSMLNPEDVKPLATSTPWLPMIDIYSLWIGMLGSSFYLRGFREEIYNYRSGSGIQMAGYDQYGNKRPMMAGGLGNVGAGARGVCDGVDAGGWIGTLEVDLGSNEVWELFVPRLELGRQIDPYSPGYGRFRAGLSLPSINMIHGAGQCVAAGLNGCAHDRLIPNLGLFGGYPGGKRTTFLLRYDDLAERMEKRLPLFLHGLDHPSEFIERFPGEVITLNHMPAPMEVKEGDVFFGDNASPGGLGDPIERSLALQKSDLDSGLTNEEISRNIYCIEANVDEMTKEWEIDGDATKKLREKKRKERLSRGVPVEQWWQQSRQRLLDKDLDPLLTEMYRSSMKLSGDFTREYKDFWALPNDFSM